MLAQKISFKRLAESGTYLCIADAWLTLASVISASSPGDFMGMDCNMKMS
jgi:hypothetical protein